MESSLRQTLDLLLRRMSTVSMMYSFSDGPDSGEGWGVTLGPWEAEDWVGLVVWVGVSETDVV